MVARWRLHGAVEARSARAVDLAEGDSGLDYLIDYLFEFTPLGHREDAPEAPVMRYDPLALTKGQEGRIANAHSNIGTIGPANGNAAKNGRF